MSNAVVVMVKLAVMSDILKAGELLKKHNLIKENANDLVKKYVEANPDINEHLSNNKFYT